MIVKDILTHHVKVNPHKTAIISDEQNLSYQELYSRVKRTANLLTDKFHLTRGDRFAVLSKNSGYIPELYYATAYTGIVGVPINYRLTLTEICDLLEDAEAKLIFIDSDYKGYLEEITQKTRINFGVVLDTDGTQGAISYKEAMNESSADFIEKPLTKDDIVLQFYTSGTTGRPKGVMISNGNIMANSWTSVAEGNIRHFDRFLNVAPMCHMSAGSRVFSLSFAGATHIILKKFNPEQVLQVMDKHKVTHALLVPTMISKLIENNKFNKNMMEHLDMITYGASPMPLPLLQEAMDLFQCNFWNGYGLTEASPMLTGLKPSDHRLALTNPKYENTLYSVGKQLLGIDIKIVNEDGEEVKPGESGEIIAKGQNIMKGYWKNPKATEETIINGWLYTGDIGMKDDEGYIYIVDRKKDMLISGGINIYPREIEKVIEDFEGIKEVAVTGMADEKWGEVPVAFIVSDQSVSTEELKSWLANRLAKFKLPKEIIKVNELPRNTTGKIQKQNLKTTYLTHH
ncbi:class I adenylate-forming enzyme family protein [Salinibacillus xinjiangensis]|uniref:Long-chain-fatty-acid--CoA ligase n=1 Tax=Salinibacillus xinjiangensis TaxID=1229268 RepID=A0A6G1X1W7_9BACI|nr:long-chain-fatty-acid--CoA ligase [Salinibacillus xinjiangensis]MRG84885.1 long-chain-fatty-acid--CoA ligase [Salinibacillus xinjiangensis]